MAASAFTTDASCIVGMEALEASRTAAHGSAVGSFTVRSGALGASSADVISDIDTKVDVSQDLGMLRSLGSIHSDCVMLPLPLGEQKKNRATNAVSRETPSCHPDNQIDCQDRHRTQA